MNTEHTDLDIELEFAVNQFIQTEKLRDRLADSERKTKEKARLLSDDQFAEYLARTDAYLRSRDQ